MIQLSPPHPLSGPGSILPLDSEKTSALCHYQDQRLPLVIPLDRGVNPQLTPPSCWEEELTIRALTVIVEILSWVIFLPCIAYPTIRSLCMLFFFPFGSTFNGSGCCGRECSHGISRLLFSLGVGSSSQTFPFCGLWYPAHKVQL